jgi:hypothetical protein
MMTGNFPVLGEQVLPPLGPARRFRARWRDPATLPQPGPGTVMVFEVAGRYGDPYARSVHGGEPHVVDATAVALVDLRERVIVVERTVPLARPGDTVTVAASFRCKVTNPAAAAQSGLQDLIGVLTEHLSGDRELGGLGHAVRPDRVADTQPRFEAQVRAYCTVNPPDVPGVSCVLGQVTLHPHVTATPLTLAEEAEQWAQSTYLSTARQPTALTRDGD